MQSETLGNTSFEETERDVIENLFEELNNFRFLDNDKFVEGWRKVKDVVAKEKIYDSLIKAEVYFYSREVKPVDFVEYKNWLQMNDKEIPDFEALVSIENSTRTKEDFDVKESGGSKSEQGEQMGDEENTVKLLDINASDSNTEDDSVAKHPANFMELIEMIQSGMKLPDTEDLNIEPLNEDPTPCVLQRPKKPWEVS